MKKINPIIYTIKIILVVLCFTYSVWATEDVVDIPLLPDAIENSNEEKKELLLKQITINSKKKEEDQNQIKSRLSKQILSFPASYFRDNGQITKARLDMIEYIDTSRVSIFSLAEGSSLSKAHVKFEDFKCESNTVCVKPSSANSLCPIQIPSQDNNQYGIRISGIPFQLQIDEVKRLSDCYGRVNVKIKPSNWGAFYWLRHKQNYFGNVGIPFASLSFLEQEGHFSNDKLTNSKVDSFKIKEKNYIEIKQDLNTTFFGHKFKLEVIKAPLTANSQVDNSEFGKGNIYVKGLLTFVNTDIPINIYINPANYNILNIKIKNGNYEITPTGLQGIPQKITQLRINPITGSLVADVTINTQTITKNERLTFPDMAEISLHGIRYTPEGEIHSETGHINLLNSTNSSIFVNYGEQSFKLRNLFINPDPKNKMLYSNDSSAILKAGTSFVIESDSITENLNFSYENQRLDLQLPADRNLLDGVIYLKLLQGNIKLEVHEVKLKKDGGVELWIFNDFIPTTVSSLYAKCHKKGYSTQDFPISFDGEGNLNVEDNTKYICRFHLANNFFIGNNDTKKATQASIKQSFIRFTKSFEDILKNQSNYTFNQKNEDSTISGDLTIAENSMDISFPFGIELLKENKMEIVRQVTTKSLISVFKNLDDAQTTVTDIESLFSNSYSSITPAFKQYFAQAYSQGLKSMNEQVKPVLNNVLSNVSNLQHTNPTIFANLEKEIQSLSKMEHLLSLNSNEATQDTLYQTIKVYSEEKEESVFKKIIRKISQVNNTINQLLQLNFKYINNRWTLATTFDIQGLLEQNDWNHVANTVYFDFKKSFLLNITLKDYKEYNINLQLGSLDINNLGNTIEQYIRNLLTSKLQDALSAYTSICQTDTDLKNSVLNALKNNLKIQSSFGDSIKTGIQSVINTIKNKLKCSLGTKLQSIGESLTNSLVPKQPIKNKYTLDIPQFSFNINLNSDPNAKKVPFTELLTNMSKKIQNLYENYAPILKERTEDSIVQINDIDIHIKSKDQFFIYLSLTGNKASWDVFTYKNRQFLLDLTGWVVRGIIVNSIYSKVLQGVSKVLKVVSLNPIVQKIGNGILNKLMNNFPIKFTAENLVSLSLSDYINYDQAKTKLFLPTLNWLDTNPETSLIQAIENLEDGVIQIINKVENFMLATLNWLQSETPKESCGHSQNKILDLLKKACNKIVNVAENTAKTLIRNYTELSSQIWNGVLQTLVHSNFELPQFDSMHDIDLERIFSKIKEGITTPFTFLKNTINKVAHYTKQVTKLFAKPETTNLWQLSLKINLTFENFDFLISKGISKLNRPKIQEVYAKLNNTTSELSLIIKDDLEIILSVASTVSLNSVISLVNIGDLGLPFNMMWAKSAGFEFNIDPQFNFNLTTEPLEPLEGWETYQAPSSGTEVEENVTPQAIEEETNNNLAIINKSIVSSEDIDTQIQQKIDSHTNPSDTTTTSQSPSSGTPNTQ